MKLITRIDIVGFRSLVEVPMSPVGNLTCYVGANNCGKSNILRALNLFFTGQPEPNLPLNLYRDCYADPTSKKKKEIGISVSFKLPSNFRFRKGLEEVEQKLGREFIVRRRWAYYPPEPTTEFSRDGQPYQRLDPGTLRQFTDLINFRYIPNRIVPTQVLREETTSFQAAVGKQLRRKNLNAEELLSGIRQAAAFVLSEADSTMRETTESIEALEIDTPLEVAALAAFSGFRAVTPKGARLPDYVLGAGSQALLMFVLLKIIDTDYSRHFGWRQATIWAVEEPESSLHRDLEQRLALMFGEWSHQERLKMQVLTTTHSEIFATAADDGFMVDIKQGATRASHRAIPDLVHRAASAGISGLVEPVLCFPSNPVVLVEGPLDRRVLSHVAQHTGVALGFAFLSLPELDPMETASGVDHIIRYLKRQGRLAQNRAKTAPFMVLLDWEVEEEKLQQARKHYGTDAENRVLRMNPSHADPRVSSDIHGIERFYPAQLFKTAREQNALDVAIDQAGNISVEKEKLKNAKTKLADMLCSAPDDGWYGHLSRVLDDVRRASALLPGTQTELNW